MTDPAVGFARTPKDTIARKPSEALYTVAINEILKDDLVEDNALAGSLERVWLDETKSFVRSALHAIRPDSEQLLNDDDDFFLTQAMDSLNVVELVQRLRLGLSKSSSSDSNTLVKWGRLIHKFPTINGLANGILSLRFYDKEIGHTESITADDLARDLTAKLPKPNIGQQKLSSSSNEKQHIILLGARGRLGPFIMQALLDSPNVASTKCLNRSREGKSLVAAFQNRANEVGLSVDTGDPWL